jgi:hypothetical protein
MGSGYKVGAIGANLDDFLLAPVGSVKRAIGDEIILKHPDTKVETYEEAHKKMLNEKFGFVSGYNLVIKRNKDNCLFIDIPQDVKTFQVGFGFPKHFEYTALQAIKQNLENGVIDRILKKSITKPCLDCGGGTALESMGWGNVISAFALIGGGLLLSVVVFCIEMVRSKMDSKMIRKDSLSRKTFEIENV